MGNINTAAKKLGLEYRTDYGFIGTGEYLHVSGDIEMVHTDAIDGIEYEYLSACLERAKLLERLREVEKTLRSIVDVSHKACPFK